MRSLTQLWSLNVEQNENGGTLAAAASLMGSSQRRWRSRHLALRSSELRKSRLLGIMGFVLLAWAANRRKKTKKHGRVSAQSYWEQQARMSARHIAGSSASGTYTNDVQQNVSTGQGYGLQEWL